MKKIIAVVFSALFALSAAVIAGAGHEGHGKEMRKDKDGHCMMQPLDADYSVKNTRDGAVITIKAKKGGADVKTIQEKAKKCVNKCNAKAAAEAKAGDEEVVCPVMGVKMKKSKAHSSWEYKGKTYYFCCAGCPEAFKKDPEKYIK